MMMSPFTECLIAITTTINTLNIILIVRNMKKRDDLIIKYITTNAEMRLLHTIEELKKYTTQEINQ